MIGARAPVVVLLLTGVVALPRGMDPGLERKGGGEAPEVRTLRDVSTGEPDPGPRPEELEDLYRARDYFGLRTALERRERSGTPRARFLRAAVLHAFNRPAESNGVVETLLAGPAPLSDTLGVRAQRLRYHNFLRLHRYEDAVEAGEAVLELATGDEELEADVRNELRALRALRDVPPQTVVRRAPTVVESRRGRIPVSVDGVERAYGLDTGANFSILMRSEARSLDLRIRDAGVELGTATDVRVTADVAVARTLRLGAVELRNVVFLVLPDAALTFPGGFQVRGLIGFPVLEALGAVRFGPDETVAIPSDSGSAGPENLALEQLTPLVRVGFREGELLCRLDTGAGRTAFYEPFFREHRGYVEDRGRPHTATAIGAGGAREVRAFRLPSVRIEVGGSSFDLEAVDVYGEALAEEGENYLDCNLGRDLLDSRAGYTVDFRSMSLTFAAE